MKIYVSEKELKNTVGVSKIKGYKLQFTDILNKNHYKRILLKSLEQHEEEIRKQERQKVIAELEEWADENLTKLIKRGYFLPNNLRGLRLVEYEELKQKLNDMKGEK